MAKNMSDIHRSYFAMSQLYTKRTTQFPFGNGFAAYSGKYKTKPALVDFGLAAVYEKSAKRGVTSSLQTYKHPQTDKTGQNSAGKQAESPLHDWYKSLNEQSKAYADKFKEDLKQRKGTLTAEEKTNMQKQFTQWLDDQRKRATERFGADNKLMEKAAKRLEKFSGKLWSALEQEIGRNSSAAKPGDKQPAAIGTLSSGSWVHPQNPLERAEQIYDGWNQSLSDLAEDYLDSLQTSLDDLGTVVDDEQRLQMEEQLYQWLGEQREQLESSLSDLPHGIAKKYLYQADQALETVTDSMWGSIEEMISRHNGAVQTAEQLYSEWNESLGGLSDNFFDAFKENLSKLAGAVSDEQKQMMYQGLTDWLTLQGENLEELLKDSPNGILKLLLERSDETLNELSERLWSKMEEEIRKHNLSIPPVNLPPVQVPVPADSVFRPGGTIRIEVTQGDRKALLFLRDSSSLTRDKTMFYVVDALGNKKAVSVTFNDARLQAEFNKRFKASSMYGKTVSLEKFNRFVEKLKSSLKEINEVDLERLRSKIFGKEEESRVDVLVKNFSELLAKMKM